MGSKGFSSLLGRLTGMGCGRRRERRPALPQATVRCLVAPPASEVCVVASLPAGGPGKALSYQALRDVYCILRVRSGAPIAERLGGYRQHLLSRGVPPDEADKRVAEVRPFLGALLGDELDGASEPSGHPVPAGADDRSGSVGYAIRLPTGEVQLLTETTVLTNQHADGLLGGGADLVWVDAAGTASRLDVFVQEYDDEEDEPDAGGEEASR